MSDKILQDFDIKTSFFKPFPKLSNRFSLGNSQMKSLTDGIAKLSVLSLSITSK